MRSLHFLCGAALLLISSSATLAQDDKPDIREELQNKIPPKIRSVRTGFRATAPEELAQAGDVSGRYKVGMMAPVYVEIEGGSKGIGVEKEPVGHLVIETSDSEDVGTQYHITNVTVGKKETKLLVGYAKAGYMNSEIKVRFRVGDHPPLQAPPERDRPLPVNTHLYLALGARVPDLQLAVGAMLPRNERGEVQAGPGGEAGFRYVAHESSLEHLPKNWYGYEGVDLLVLTTADKDFLTGLGQQKDRLKAIADWVRRGGRLIIPVAYHTQDIVAKVLTDPMWDPPVPVVPPANAGDVNANPLRRLPKVEEWGGVQNKPFPTPGEKPVPVAVLDPGNVPPGAWDVQARSEDGRVLVARVKYGLGQITYLAFSFDDPRGFARWEGRSDFLKGMIDKLAPPTGGQVAQGEVDVRGQASNDLATEVLSRLDNFDVRVIPFAYVALFIVLYILIVGPLDFFLLKYVFKRLELTWITFPAVVLAVSVIAYFAAYAIKGNDLKVNKIDLVDFDLRTGFGAKEGSPAQAYGRSFFTILSPRIQSYTVGLEPNPAFWGGTVAASKPLSADLLTWMGRPDTNPWGMNRSGSQGFFRNPYRFVPEQTAEGLEGVPIPVWTTKAFTASWEKALEKPPVQAELTYHHSERGTNVVVSGTLQNDLAVDLQEAWLMYDNSCYRLEDLPAGKKQKLSLELIHKKDLTAWLQQPDDEKRGVPFNPTSAIRPILFQEKANLKHMANHTLRSLDFSWRVRPDSSVTGRDQRTREAVLVARIRFQAGLAQDVQGDAAQPLPTRLWLGETPATGKSCPPLPGYLNQDTFVRILLPVRPVAE